MREPVIADLAALDRRVVLFPVRHHSPAAARLVVQLIDCLQPAAVLIEGPADFNPRLAELFLPHKPPIAIYSYVILAGKDGSPERLGAYYPFCEYSPEWQAARHGHERGTVVRFVDLPWAELATASAGTNRYADRHLLGSRYLQTVCERLGVDHFHDAWDTLFEIDTELSLEEYLTRCHGLCAAIRVLDGNVSRQDLQREAFMVQQIRQALDEFPNRQIFVVTGGYHSLGIHERLNGHEEISQNDADEAAPPRKVLDRGIALTPYSYERLDALTGYDAGMPNPGFYHRLWQSETVSGFELFPSLLKDVVRHLRDRKQLISAADLIAAETTARALAAIRGHAQLWRTDLLDGLTSALIKEDLATGGGHPVLDAVYAVLRGGERGVLAEGTKLPPPVQDVRDTLARLNLVADGPMQEREIPLADPLGREQSQTLHRIRILELGGYTLVVSALDRMTAAEFVETWRISWTPEFEAHLIESSRYGATLAEAATAKLAERAANVERDAGLAAALLTDAALAGLDSLSARLLATCQQLIRTDAAFPAVAQALSRLLFLYRYDPVLGMVGRPEVGQLVKEAFDRGLWLLESLGAGGGLDRAVLDGIRLLVETLERCDHDLELNGAELQDMFRRIARDRSHAPPVRGATLGGLWLLGDSNADEVLNALQEFADPERLGDFLNGLFALAREPVQRQPGLLTAVHQLLVCYDTEDFQVALPALRLAFTTFTPREKHNLARTLREALGLAGVTETAALVVDDSTALLAISFEEQLFATLERYGLRVDSPGDSA